MTKQRVLKIEKESSLNQQNDFPHANILNTVSCNGFACQEIK